MQHAVKPGQRHLTVGSTGKTFIKRILKWSGYALGVIAALGLGAVAMIYARPMSEISRTRFANLTGQESAALYEYLSETAGLDLVTSPQRLSPAPLRLGRIKPT